MQIDFTTGSIGKKIFLFTLPLMAGDVFQQLYNVVDTAIVGRALGADALAAVGSNGSLINLLVNLFVGLSLGSNVFRAYRAVRQGER